MENKQEQAKHRHHKQPQYYLKGFGFVSNSYQKIPDIWVYKKGLPYKDGINPRLESVKDTAYEKDFYAFIKEDETEDFNTYENILMCDFEQPAQSVLEKVKRFKEIDEKEMETLSKYVASMVTRGDWWQNLTEKTLARITNEFEQEFIRIVKDVEIQKTAFQIIAEENEQIKKGELFKEGIIQYAEKLAEILNKMYWRFLIAPEATPYVTSDNPVNYFHIKKSYSELFFPISSYVALSLSWRPSIKAKRWERQSKNFWKIDSNTVAVARDLICSIAFKEVYYSRKAKWLVDFVNNRA